MATYVRQSSFSDGDTITAALFNNEFNQLVNAFDVATGHTHDGSTAGDGGPLSNLFSNALVFGTNTNNDIAITFNATSNDGVLTWMEDEDYFKFSDDILLTTTEKVQFRDTAIYINSSTDGQLDIVADTEIQIAATTIDINGNADISGNLGVGGNLTVTGTTTFNGGTITMGDAATDNVVFGADVDSNIIPDDDDTYDLGSSTQQWRNLFIDGTANIDSLVADTADINGGTIDAANITVGSGKTLDVSAGTLTLADNQISGNKVEGGTINATTINTLTYGSITDGTITVTAFVDEDNMASNSATLIPTQQSVKAYVDAQDTAQDLDLVSDSGTIAIDLDGETLTVTGGEGIDTSATSNTLTITGEDATTSNKGIASFNSDDFNVSSGAVTLATTSTAAELNLLDGTTAGTIVASKGVAVDANKDITGFRNITLTGELDAGSLDISGNADIDGTLEADAITIAGVTLAETISDTVGAMVASNTETGIAVTYDDADNTLDFVIGDNAIVQSMIADNAIDSQMYVDGSIDLIHMSANSVDSDQYVDGSIDTAHIADSQITSAKIVDGTIATGDIADDAVTGAKLANNIDIAGTLDVTGVLTADSNVVIAGNLTVQGDTTTLNTATLDVEDKNITLNKGAGDTSGSANGAGLTIQDAVDASNDATILWDTTNDEFDFSHPINVAGKVTSTGTSVFASLDISGDIDVDGTTNLDVVDIDGAVDMASTLAIADTTTIVKTASGVTKALKLYNNTAGANNRVAIDFHTASTLYGTIEGGYGASSPEMNFIVSSVDNLKLSTGGAVFNEGGADLDFRVESNNLTHALFVDGATGNIMMGGATAPETTGLSIETTSSSGGLNIISPNTGRGDIFFGDTADLNVGQIRYAHSDNSMTFRTNAADALVIASTGAATFSSSITIPDYIHHTSDANTYFGFQGGDQFELETGGANRMSVVGSETVFNDDGGDKDFRVESDGNAHAFHVDGATAYVGVGTATPRGPLHVYGSNYAYMGPNVAGVTPHATTGGIAMGWNKSSGQGESIIAFNKGGGATGGLVLANNDGGTYASRVVLSSIGGINTTPAAGGHAVFNEDGVDADFRVESDGNANMLFVDGGENRVGVGTGSPATLLEIDSNSAPTLRISNSKEWSGADSGTVGELQFYMKDSSTPYGTKVATFIKTTNNAGSSVPEGELSFGTSLGGGASTNAVERFRIAADGSLSTPTAGTSNVRFGVNAGNSIASGGNYNTVVGDEAGTAITTGDYNTALGYVAGDAITDGSRNTAVGAFSLTTNILGSRTVAVGFGALETMNPASSVNMYNVGVGYNAGYAVTTGIENTLIGSLAGDALTDADYNVALGSEALSTDTKGSRSVAIGRAALNAQNFTTATNTYNVAIGFDAGKAVTTGTALTLIGGLAGDALTDCDFNTAIGFASLSDDTLGSKTTAVGYQALATQNFASATDTYNTALGFQAGKSVTTGIQNTLIGGLAGDALTDADYNVALGTSALSADTLGSRAIAIGAGALSRQNFTSATDNYNIGIGYDAGLNITTGVQNTLIGNLAGDALTDADRNVAIGYEALTADDLGSRTIAVGAGAAGQQNYASATDSHNICIGDLAGFYNVTGTKNTWLGSAAGLGASGQSNSNNTGIGYNTGLKITTGAQNTLIGGLAGDSITTGNRNTILGYNSATSLADGSDNVALGNQVEVAASVANTITLGSGISATGSNDFSFGKASNVVTNDFDADANWSRSSDERLKKNIVNQSLGLDFINDLRTVKYNWKPSNELDASDAQLAHLRRQDADGNVINDMNTTVTMHNFIAQEVKTALDTAGVSSFGGWKEDDFGVQQVSREMFVIPLVKAVQELSTQLDAALARITTLEG